MALGLSIALVVNARIRGRAFFRSAFYFPSIASSVAITTIAIYILNSDGLLNRIIGEQPLVVRRPEHRALVDRRAERLDDVRAPIMLFYLAALQSIPTDVYEAAAVDGTGAWRTFWRITFPLLKPAHFFVLVVFGIGALKVFDQAFIVSGGHGRPGLLDADRRPLHLPGGVPRASSSGSRAAAGVVLFVVIFVLTLLQRGDGRTGGDRLMAVSRRSHAAEPLVPPASVARAVVRRIVLYVAARRLRAALLRAVRLDASRRRSRRCPTASTST